MTTEADDWHRILSPVTGELVRGEQRVTTHELLTVHLGVPVSDQACRRLRRVMRELGWKGPRKMRGGQRTTNGYWRHPTVGLPANVLEQPAPEVAAVGAGTLPAELERVTRLGLQKLEQILRIPTDRRDGNLLRAQTAAAAAAMNAQLRADETRLREQRSGSSEVLARLLELIRRDQAAQKASIAPSTRMGVTTIKRT
jgi:hypothetical protein